MLAHTGDTAKSVLLLQQVFAAQESEYGANDERVNATRSDLERLLGISN